MLDSNTLKDSITLKEFLIRYTAIPEKFINEYKFKGILNKKGFENSKKKI